MNDNNIKQRNIKIFNINENIEKENINLIKDEKENREKFINNLNTNYDIVLIGTLYNQPIKIVPPPYGVEFGKYCAIAPNLKIIGTNHDYSFPAVQNTFYNEMFIVLEHVQL